MSRNYPRLSIVDFARHTVSSGDLDPIYVALNKVAWSINKKLRFLVAYCAYYNAGVAAWMSDFDGSEFWDWMLEAARNEDHAPAPYGGRWPRGHERRHFRGAQAVKGIEDWQKRWPEPEEMFRYIGFLEPSSYAQDGMPFEMVRARAMSHRSVGEWLSFKMVDLVDACLGIPVDQSNVMNFMYDTPLKSLFRQWAEIQGWPVGTMPKSEEHRKEVIIGMNRWLARALNEQTIPHKPGKPLDNFCLETIWCKHQSHLNGHYPLNNDLVEIRAGLAPWLAHSVAAQEFNAAMPGE